ncbi:MAG: hypothetical protein JSU04_06355 [Bdellovibrionales bacterium]|nr:hypothetical protein [Bdellovibrionales bacterium]
MKYIIVLSTLIFATSLKSFAGNGDVGSADDNVFSRTTMLHEPYNSQTEALRMSELCQKLESGKITAGTCLVQCRRISENVLGMFVAKEGLPPIVVEFQPEDQTLMTFWGAGQQHEYLNSKNTYMNIWLYGQTGASISMDIRKGTEFQRSCGKTIAH